MATTSTVQVEVYDFNADQWSAYEFLGSRPGSVEVLSPYTGRGVWVARSVVRFP